MEGQVWLRVSLALCPQQDPLSIPSATPHPLTPNNSFHLKQLTSQALIGMGLSDWLERDPAYSWVLVATAPWSAGPSD